MLLSLPIIKDSMKCPEVLLGTLIIVFLSGVCLVLPILKLEQCFKLVGIAFYFLSLVSLTMMILMSTTFMFSTLVYSFSGQFFYFTGVRQTI